jgi:hypothetical protein
MEGGDEGIKALTFKLVGTLCAFLDEPSTKELEQGIDAAMA